MKIGNKEVQNRSVFLFLYCIFAIWLGSSTNSNFLIFWLIGWVVIAHLVAEAAERKNRNYSSFLFLSLILSPLLMGLIVAIMANPNKK